MEEHRSFTTRRLLALTDEDFASAGLAKGMGGTGDFGASVTAFEMLGHGDLSLLVKAGVQFGLFGGALANLGTQRHHTAYVPGMLDGSLLGCFAMTETGHGSNVQHLETTATHDPSTDEPRHPLPQPRCAEELHRQRGPRRADGGGVRAGSSPPTASRTASTASSCRSATRAVARSTA